MKLLPMLAVAVALLAGCDRRTEPFDPNERVEAPDLSKIFPEGARVVEERERAGSGAPEGAASAAAESGAPIRGTIELASGLEGAVPRGAVLFLVARNPSGGPPVAVKRIADPRFPMEYEIGPGDRMIESVPFVGPLFLTARVDADGNASSRQPGDLAGAASAPVQAGASDVTIRIDQKLDTGDLAAGGSAPAAAPSASGGRGAPPLAAESGGGPIRGTIVLASELEGAVRSGSVLFLVARRPTGGPPVAVKRIADPRFPMEFEIGPGDRMIQTTPFAGPLFLTARVDADGNATSREPGDLAGAASAPVDAGASGVTIRIEQRL